MSTDTRHPQYDDATLLAAMNEACDETAKAHNIYLNALDLKPGNDYWEHEAPARLALARALLARLPEPTPPTADGKTPGQVCWETWAVIPPAIEHGWGLIQNKEAWESAASAVLAAFGVEWKAIAEKAIAEKAIADHWCDMHTVANARAEKAEAELESVWNAETWTPKVGDVVTLRSRGPKMTVMRITESACCAIWFHDGVPRECDFLISTLTPAKEAQP